MTTRPITIQVTLNIDAAAVEAFLKACRADEAPPENPVEKLGYSIEEAAEALGVKRTTLYELLDSSELESIKVGRRRIIPADSVRAYIDSRRSDT